MPGFTELTLQHSAHASSLLKRLNALKNCNQFCDCKLIIGDEAFPVHRSVLAASSPFFRALFTTDMIERGLSRITLHGFSAQTFQSVLKYVYTGEVTLNPANITHVYTVADRLQLEGLKDLCHDYLLNQLTAANCIGIWKFAGVSNRKLEDSAWRYMMAHFTNVKEGLEFLCLGWSEVQYILSSCQWRLDSALCKWLHHDINRRVGEKDLFSVRSGELQKSREDGICIPHQIAVGNHTASAVHIPGSLYPPPSLVAVGGYCEGMEKTCEQYCENTGTWQLTTWDLSGCCRYFHWVGVIGLRLYAIAGDSLTKINMVLSKLTDEAAKQLQTDALGTGWELEVTLPYDCSNMKFCIMDDCIYGCGGCGEMMDNTYGIYRYNPTNGSWKLVVQFPSEPRVFFQFFSHECKLHLIGGMLHETSNCTASSSYEVYDPGSNAWERNCDMAVGRYNFGVGVLDHCLYVMGGFGDDEILLSSVEMYCFGTKTWSRVSALPTPRASMACQSLGEKLYCLGGETTGTSADVLVLDPLDGGWITTTPLNHPRIYLNIIIL